MIPFTPDERRAEFAPSQNPGGPVDPDVLAVLGQPAQEPAMAQPTMNQQVDPDVLDIVNRDQIPLMSSLMSASRVNPDQAAEASRLGARIGVGQDVALRNLDEVRQRAFMADMQARDIARTNPVLASFLMDRNFSQQASDDVGVLDGLKNVFMDVGRVAGGMPATYIPSELVRGYMRGQRIVERGEIGLAAQLSGMDDSQYERARQVQEELQALGTTGLLGKTAEVIAQQVSSAREIAASTLVGTAAGSWLGPIGAGIGGTIGFGAGTLATTTRIESGNSYLDMREEGIPEDVAVPAALAVGLINGAIEVAGAKIALAPFKGMLTKVLREQVAEAVKKPTMRAALAQAGKSYVLQVGTEAAEEGLQETVGIAGEELAKVSSGMVSETTVRQAVDRIIDATAQGAMGAAIIGGIGPGANLAIDLKRAQRAGRQTKFFESLTQNATESKVRGRDAGAYERFVAAQAAGTNAETVFVDGATMRGVLEQAAVTDSQLDAVVPGLAQKVRDAATTGSDVTIPTAQYAARLAGTDLGNALLPHMRLAPDAISATEAQAVEASRAEIVAQAEKLMEEKQTVDAAFVQSAQAVEDSIFNAVKAVGYSDVQARTYAKIHQAMAVVDAAAMGITPEEYNRKYPPTIVGEGMPVQAMEQAARIDSDYVAAVERGDMATAQRMVDEAAERQMPSSKVRDSDGKLLRIYHGSQRIDRVGNRLLKKRATSGPMPFFTNTRAIAEGYAQGKQDTSIEDIGYEQWVKYKPRGQRGTVNLDQAWLYLTPEERAAATERLYTVGYANPDEGTGDIVGNTETIASRDHVQYLIREARGNALTAAKELWLNSGSLFNEEQKFMDVLRGLGLEDGFIYDSPHAVKAGIIEAYANITNPLDTSAIPASVVDALQNRANRVRKPAAQYGVDPWDKQIRDPAEWMKRLRYDIAEGKTTAWTSIPDWVTDVLTNLGYDGIMDMGGKFGGEQHTVWIPFNPNQIKFAMPITKDSAGKTIPISERFDLASPMMFRQAAIPFAQAPVSPGFYSALAKAVDAVDAKSIAASGWKERIKGLVNKGDVKQDEVDWSGLTDWLDMQEGKVTKESVAEFLKNNGVRVERVQLGGTELENLRNEHARAEMDYDDALEAERAAAQGTDEAAWNAADARLSEARRRVSVLSAKLAETERAATKYGQYTLPGGTNYREVMITLPVDQEARRAAQERYNALVAEGVPLLEAQERARESVASEYRSPHWNQPNVLVHFRLNDRVDADGKRVLFVEEIQSDWGQAGRDVGFVPTAVRRQAIIDEYNAAQAELAAAVPGTDAQASAYERVDRAEKAYNKEINDASIPRAPFVETTDGWLNLAIKNILLEATRGNYDRVAFVNGKQSADRYDLSKQVKQISWIEIDDSLRKYLGETVATKTVTIRPIDGKPFDILIDDRGIAISTGSQFDGKPLDEIVPKEIADQIMAERSGDIRGDGLKVGGRGMIEFYDKIVPAAVNKLLKKYGGGKLETANIRLATMATRDELTQSVYGRNETYETLPENAKKSIDEVMRRGGSSQPAFSVTPEMVKKLESGLPLFQAMPAGGPARGGFDPRRLTTIINKGADVTTLFHELIHYKVEVYLRIASAPDAPARIKADLDELFKFMGVAGATFEERLATYNGLTFEQRRPLEEKITYNFEDYLLEGKAPSVEMRGVFDRIAAWMRRVYKSLRDDLNAIYRREFGTDLPILTPEIRAVFDRMLASEEQIKRAEAVNNMKGLFQTQAESRMDDATWAAYQAMLKEATDSAIAALTADTMKQVEWMSNARSKKLKELQKAHDTQRKEVRDQVMAEVRQEPIYRAMEYLKRGTLIGPDGSEATVEGVHKISTALAREFVPGLDMAKMGRGKYGYLAEDGLHPDIVAEMFGFPAGSALLQALADAKPMREVVDARTDEIMVRDYSEMGDPKAQEAAVNRAIHNEARARLVAVEARWLSKATQPVRVIQEAARQAAVDAVGNTVIRDLRPDQYAAAEARASRDAIEAARGADTKRLRDRYGADATREQIMLQAKRQQLYQNALATEAQKADDAIQKGLKYLRRVLRDSNRKRMGADSADQISAILDNFSLVPMTRAQREKVRALRDWLATNAENGLMLDVDPALADAANRKNYVEMTVTEFNDLIDSVKQIEYNGKHEAEIRLGKEKAIFAEKRDEITANMEQVAEKRGRKVRKELGDEDRKWMNTIASWDASQQTIGSITYLLDGGQRDGPLSRYLVATANDAGNQESEDTARITEIVNNILDPIAKKGGFSAKKITFPQIGEALSLRNRMVIALNYGNQSNIDRLLAGEGWSEETVQQIIATLTEEELNAVQALWDVMSSFKDRVAEKSRRLTGKEPRWIDPKPFTIRSSDGKIVQMRGGYYPAKYNPLRSIGARVAEVAEDADRMRREAFTASTTSRSFEKNRSDRPPQGQVLTREFTGLYAGLKEVIHDLAWHDWSIAANRLLRDKDFQRIIKERYGNQTYTAIKDWVDTVVVGDRTKHDPFEMFAVYARRNVSAAAMGLRLMTAAIQPTGVFPAMSRNGIRSMVRASAEFGYAPLQSTRNAVERSKFMENRNRTRFRDLNEIRNVVQEESALSRVQKKYLSSAYVLVSFVQGVVDTITWMSAYSNSIAAGKSEQDAIFIADQTVIDTQGSGRLQDLSRAMRGGEKQSAYAKLFTSFYQYSNTMYALATTQVRTAPNYGKMTKDLVLILMVGALVEEMIRHALKPSADEEPEDMMKKLVGNQIDFVIGLPFGLREFRGVGAWMMDTKGGGLEYRGPSGLRMVSDVNRALVQIKQGEFDRALRKSIITLMGTTFGIPSAQINDTIDGIEALYEGETENVLAPVTGVRR